MVASSCEVKAKMVAMITDLYPRHTQEDPATIILGMRVSRDRTNRTVTVHYEAVVSDTLQTHVLSGKSFLSKIYLRLRCPHRQDNYQIRMHLYMLHQQTLHVIRVK